MSAVETGQMTAAETSVLSQQKTSVLSQQQILCVSETCSGPDTSKSPYLDNRTVTQIWPEIGRESTVWRETWSRSMPGPFRSLWDGSNPLQGAVPSLFLEVQVGSTMSIRAQIIESRPNRVQNQPGGPNQRPNESYGLSGPIRTTPKAKNGQKTDFSKKTAPGGRPAARRRHRRTPCSPVWGPMQRSLGCVSLELNETGALSSTRCHQTS